MQPISLIRILWICAWIGILTEAEILYRLEGYSSPYYVQTLTTTAMSRIICATICSESAGGFFSYRAGVCKVHDAGMAPAATSNIKMHLYRFYDPSVPPQVLTNIAFGKPTLAKDQHAQLSPDRAVDADLSTQYHSGSQDDPWWRVDLEDLYIIRVIDVLPHPGVPNWFVNVKIFVGTTSVTDGVFSSYTEVGHYPGTWDGVGRLEFTPTNLTAGQYVVIQGLSGTQFLNLMDVKVMV